MKTTELMIGDWVYFNCFDGSKIIVKITAINNNNGLVYGVSEYGSHWCNIDKVEPITLTLEILEKNGFELRDGFLYHRIDDKPHHYDFKLRNGGVFSSEGYTLECGIYHLTIRYVHELQNALRLCGLDELADNIKLEELI